MTDIGSLKVTLVRRGFWDTLVRAPRLFTRHYQTMRRSSTSRIIAAYGAWVMTSLVVRMPRHD
jgi:hypothetical protein